VARYTNAACRLCRREGMKLYLKGERCFKDKCAMERRPFPPGQHGQRSRPPIGYAAQLREKEKVKRIYGVLERQFRKYYEIASRKKGVTGEILLGMLERRLDNVVYRLGFASSRRQARQLVNHGHIVVDNRKVDIASFQVKEGQEIQVREKSRKNPFIEESVKTAKGRGLPEWLELNPEEFKGVVKAMPKRSDIAMDIQEQLIIELYSK